MDDAVVGLLVSVDRLKGQPALIVVSPVSIHQLGESSESKGAIVHGGGANHRLPAHKGLSFGGEVGGVRGDQLLVGIIGDHIAAAQAGRPIAVHKAHMDSVVAVGGNFIHLSVKLILLQDQGQSRLLAGIADVLGFLIPTVEGIALGDRESIEAVGIKILSADTICVAVVCNLVAVTVQDVVVHRVLIPHHSDDIGPAIDGDAGQAVHVLARFIAVPRAVVEPAVKLETLCKLIRFVVVIDIELV